MSKGLKIFITIIIVAGIGIFLFFIFNVMFSINKLSIEGNTIEIKGLYSKSIEFDSIQDLTLLENIPVFSRRTNGSSVNEIKKGYFTLEDGSAVFVYIEKYETPPFIEFTSNDKQIIINLESSDKTRNLYDEIKEKVSE